MNKKNYRSFHKLSSYFINIIQVEDERGEKRIKLFFISYH